MGVEITIADVLNDFYVDIVCNGCGKSLEASWWKGQLIVDPCDKCMEKAKNEGYEDGLSWEG